MEPMADGMSGDSAADSLSLATLAMTYRPPVPSSWVINTGDLRNHNAKNRHFSQVKWHIIGCKIAVYRGDA